MIFGSLDGALTGRPRGVAITGVNMRLERLPDDDARELEEVVGVRVGFARASFSISRTLERRSAILGDKSK